ncbi:hypothetical protein [Clostridium sp. VAP52]|uniref:hypothetical protein n=1 Tax=Clostridium sp. VAP52 TaxID=2949977 RepID=UPI002079E100|nr:hypothetical protein [Clostridium sp. VAP52]
MEYKDRIEEKNIWQGNLIFLIHKEKPTKTGWWRKIRTEDKEIIYLLEQPMHKDFNLDNEEIKDSRIDRRIKTCVMKDSTLRYGQVKLDKFDVLASAGAISQMFIIQNNYMKNCNENNFEALMSMGDIMVTEGFEELFRMYIDRNNNCYKSICSNLI